MSNKTYVAVRTPDGTQVDVISDGKVLPLHHVVQHSPSGLEWSYAGSGPADLALSILADHFGEKPTSDQLYWGTPKCWMFHQHFKFAFIATAPQEGFELTTAQIDAWLKEFENEAQSGDGNE